MKDFTGPSSSSPKTQKKHERAEQDQEEWELIKRKQERAKQKSIQLHSNPKIRKGRNQHIVGIL